MLSVPVVDRKEDSYVSNGRREGPRQRRFRPDRKRKVCMFCAGRGKYIVDYKDVSLLKRFVDERGRIKKARQSGACRRHQSRVALAIKRAREMALLPYTTD